MSANRLAYALSGNITLALANNGDLLSLPVGQTLGKEKRVIRFGGIHQAATLKVQAALDDFMEEHKKWLKIS